MTFVALGLGTQMWKWYKEYQDDPPKEWTNIVSKATGGALDIYRHTCNGVSCKVGIWGVHYGSNQLFKKDSQNKIASKYSPYNVLAVKDGKLVVLKSGSQSTLSIQNAPPQNKEESLVFKKCPEAPPPFEGTCLKTSKSCPNSTIQ